MKMSFIGISSEHIRKAIKKKEKDKAKEEEKCSKKSSFASEISYLKPKCKEKKVTTLLSPSFSP
jgi:hypothetical protein